MRRAILAISVMLPTLLACPAPEGGDDETSLVGTFDGLHNDIATGFNFPFDIGVAPDDPVTEDTIEGGDIFVASYGTSEIFRVPNPTDMTSATSEPFFDGGSEGLAGAMAVSIPLYTHVWAAFEQGGTDDGGGVVVLDETGAVVVVFDAANDPEAFANPGGLCFGGWSDDGLVARFFMTNLGDGTAWRMDVSALDGSDPVFTRVGSGLATGTLGNPGSPGNELSSSNDLPQGGARGCVYAGGSLYVADAQNARVVRFDEADLNGDIELQLLEETPPDLVTYPTDVTINSDGYLIIISYDNAHAFLTLELPNGGFIDNGLQDLNVNSGNYGTAVAFDTIWFTRANNSNGALRAVTPEQGVLPTTVGPFPPQ